MLKAVLFDLDGTLLDTLPDIHAHLNQTLRAFSYPEITEQETQSYVGDGAKKLVERALPEGAKNVDECYEFFREGYSGSRNIRTQLFEGELETLEKLKAHGLKLAVITNKPHAATLECIKKFFPEGTFEFVGGDSGMFACKPDPSLARYAALTMRVALNECVFVGDGEADVLTAQNAKMRHIGVLWGYRTRQQLEKVGAREFVSSFQELEKILANA